jgi:glycosyltransferase involved in cell wall biosynthesis
MKVAIIHYWLTNMRGGEKVLEAICELFPQADIYTHVLERTNLSDTLNQHRIITTFIDRLPFANKFYAWYLPFMPMALEALDLSDYDLIISSEAGPAKGIIPPPDSLHICYTHSPMRYLWDMFYQYWGDSHWLKRLPIHIMSHYLRLWDVNSAARTDEFVANSSFVASRIKKYYRRESTLIHPPVDIDRFYPVDKPEKDFYLWVGELTSYKRPMDVINAFRDSGQKLIMVGRGNLSKQIKHNSSENIELIDHVTEERLRALYQHCRALIYSGIEDFGITPVEAMACGRPVIAFDKGGVKDTIIHKKTGFLYSQQTADGLLEAINAFELIEDSFQAAAIRRHSEQFSKANFKENFLGFINHKLNQSKSPMPS